MSGQPWTKIELESTSPEYIKVWKLFKASNPKLKMVDKVNATSLPSHSS